MNKALFSFLKILVIQFVCILNINAQTDSISSGYSISENDSLARLDSLKTTRDVPKINKLRFATVVATSSALYVGSMAYLQFVWYHDHARVPFHFYNDLAGYNQIDKCGHMYGSYLESYLGFHSLLWAGVSRKKALWFGGTMGFIMQLPIEIWDGMYEGWGFSLSDMGANALGSVLVIGQELAFKEQVVKYKLSFSPSPYAPLSNGYLGEGFDQLFNDYNGHTYWLSIGMNRLIPSKHIPDWLNLAFGYSAGGMYGEFKNIKQYRRVAIPETERYRQFLLSLDIDFSKIKTRHPFLKTIFDAMFILKVPLPTLEYNTKGQWLFHPLYF